MKILNSCEHETASTLVKAAEKFDAHVSFKMSLRDALSQRLSVSENRLPKDEYNFARLAHLDFVVGRDFEIDFALEYDGPFHTWTRVVKSDCKKNAICDKLSLPLFRICAGNLKRGQEAPVVMQLVDMFYASRQSCNIKPKTIEYSSKFHGFARGYIEAYTSETIQKRAHGRVWIETIEDHNGYTESRMWLSAGGVQIQIGFGRCHVPKETTVCGKQLAEYLAFLHACNVLEQHTDQYSDVMRTCGKLVHGGTKAQCANALNIS